MLTTPGTRGRPRSIAWDFGRWTRAFYLTLPFLLAANYVLIFHWPLLDSAWHAVWPSSSFHPAPFPHISHARPDAAHEDDYWTWDTPSQFVRPTLNWNTSGAADADADADCAEFPTHLLRKIQVVLKVGAADDWTRTDGQLGSVVRCIANVLVVSDQGHAYGRAHTAVDVLAGLPAETYMQEEDYAIYTRQKNVSAGELRQGHEGWKIDKYKFLPEVESAVERSGDAEWYVFLESDTYVFWDNVFRLLENYEHTEPYYFGSPAPGRRVEGKGEEEETVWFAYGGCGFILSNAAAHRLVDRKRNVLGVKGPRVADEYMEDVQKDCCGDSILGWALYDKAAVSISGLWPMFNPHSLAGVPFGKLYWCEPVISLHKTDARDFRKLWAWENARDRSSRPLLYADLLSYHGLGSFSRRDDWDAADWDSFSEPDDHAAHSSLDACDSACRANERCFQFTWHGRHCYMAHSMRLGHAKDPDGKHDEEDRRYISGWDVDKIKSFVERETCSDGAHWVKPSIKRIY